MEPIKNRVIAVVALGWLAPAVLSWHFARAAAQLQIAGERNLHSFPYESEARRMMAIAAVWMAVAAAYWVVRIAVRRLPSSRRLVASRSQQ